MLQFWKRSDRKQKGKLMNGSPKVSQITDNSTKSQEDIAQLDVQNGPYVPRSRLSKTLSEVLADKDALGYFIQFMDSKSALALIKFWLDIESFRSASNCADENDEVLLSPEDYSIISNISMDINSPADQIDEVFEYDDNKSDTRSLNNHVKNDFESLHNENDPRMRNGNGDIPNRHSRINSFKSDCSKLDGDNTSGDCDSLYLTAGSESEIKPESRENGTELHKTHRKLGSVQSLYLELSKNHNNIDGECNGKTSIRRTFSVPQDFNLRRTTSMTSLKKRKDLYSSIFQDALRISKKYICDNAPYHVKLPETTRSEILNKIRNNNIDPEIFTMAQEIIFALIEHNYFNQFLRSDFNTKHQIDVLTSGNVILEDIMFNETALFHFMEFLEQESPKNRDFVQFWLSAVNYRQSKNDDMEQMQSDAMTLYDKYFSLQAMNPLYLGDQIRFHVEQNICREEGPAITSFDLPLQIVQSYLEKNYLKPFLMSQLFFKYLNELINSIHTSPWPKFGHRKTGSDASSEISVSNNVKNKKNKSKDKFDMSIETLSMTDPDSLWRRKQCGLKFGRVNELGRFQSDLEREPENRSNWRLSKAMKRFVNKNDVTKEEIAWQVAEMIVKDITSLTLNHDDPS